MPTTPILGYTEPASFSVFHDGVLDPPVHEQKAFEKALAAAGIEVVDSIDGCVLVRTTADLLARTLVDHPTWVFQPSGMVAVTPPQRRVRAR